MSEYEKSVGDYINAVKKGIKWKRARDVATSELSDHINDLYDSFLTDGYDEEKALAMAIREMGSAELVAAVLNSVYKPKTNWRLILAVFGLSVIGIVMRVCSSPALITGNDALAAVLGIAASVILYFADYTIIIRRPRLLYWIFSGITIISIIYELRNKGAASYHYSFYMILLFPIVITGIACRVKKDHMWHFFFMGITFGQKIKEHQILAECQIIYTIKKFEREKSVASAAAEEQCKKID